MGIDRGGRAVYINLPDATLDGERLDIPGGSHFLSNTFYVFCF